MRVPYVSNPPTPCDDEEKATIDAILARRHPRPLTPLDLALLHSPPIANGWNTFLGAVRTRSSLPDSLREIAICRVASVNRAWYEWMHHAPLATQAGVSDAGLELVKNGQSPPSGSKPECLTEKEWTVLVAADEMTRNVRVSDNCFELLKQLFSEKEIVEIVATIACYNCVSRFLVALDVGEKNDADLDGASTSQ